MLILGLMFGYAVSAVVTVLVGASQPERLQQWAQWGFGSFSGVTWQRLRLFGPLTVVGVLIASRRPRSSSMRLLLGENYARSMGLAVRRARLLTMLRRVGARRGGDGVLRPDLVSRHRRAASLPRAARHLGSSGAGAGGRADGGAVALIAQIVSLLPGSAGVLPLNAVTSLMGAPVVVAVLLRSRRGAFAG